MSSLFADSDLPASNAPTNGGAAYKVLARKYRPSTFAELIGQEVLVKTLTNAFATGRLAQAWMLTGVRGVGKTTTARIIAKGLNCVGADGTGGPTITPCGVCASCTSIAEDRCVDVLELDAASRTGVDDMREILDGVRYAPVSCRTKVYIIDEVHMLSKSAFNALLKTLEEPPSHVKFIFATTEIRKVPVTILSRCQRFDLRRVPAEILATHYNSVAQQEGYSAEPEALRLLARAADGSVRDGLSLLDQAIARIAVDDAGKQITATDVQAMLGLADRTLTLELFAKISLGDSAAALEHYQQMIENGADALTLLQDIGDLIHLLTRGKIIPALVTDQNLSEAERVALQRLLPSHTLGGLARLWQMLLKGIAEVQGAPRPALAAEMLLVRLCYATTLPAPAELIAQYQNNQNTAQSTITETSSGTTGGSDKPPNFKPAPLAIASGAAQSFSQTHTPPAAPLHLVAQGASAHALPSAALPNTAPVANAGPSALSMQLAADWRTLVAYFLQQKEISLHAELFGNCMLVAVQPLRLEIAPLPTAPRDLASRVQKCLQAWTGDRWVVAISSQPQAGATTLATAEKALAEQRLATATAHPLVQAVLAQFNGARLTGVHAKPTANLNTTSTAPEALAEAESFTGGSALDMVGDTLD